MSTAIYNFKRVTVVPTSKDFIDIVLSKTQRKTPTVVHKGYHISRIRQFYMKKVKYTQKTINDKLTIVLGDFPRMDDVHPFFGDLMHVLYDRDHYKVALGQVSAVRHMVDNVGRDYIRLMKYGDSLYRCKQLKRAALGRMATACKKLTAALSYLEKVRQHLSRLPTVDPNAKTLLLTGFPNVGKSSFMNKVTRADVDVQPYAFTTKSLYTGHTDYKYQTWQVIDTPGILDHSLDQRNVIEMQAITALAHIRAAVLFFMDLSETCGYTIAQQLNLFKSIGPLFTGKPLVVVFNKSDLTTLDDLASDKHDEVMDALQEANAKWITTSTLTDVAIGDLKTLACDMLLAQRSEQKEGTGRYEVVQNRLYCAEPIARDRVQRPTSVPEDVLEKQEIAPEDRLKRITESVLQEENGGAGVGQYEERDYWDLENDEWRNDIMPEIMDGKNVADFIDPDQDVKLMELEAEEEKRVARKEIEESKKAPAWVMADSTMDSVRFIRDKIAVKKMERAMKDTSIRRTRQQAVSTDRFNARTGSQDGGEGMSRGRQKRARSQAADAFSQERSASHASTKITRSLSARSASKDRAPSVVRGAGFRDVEQKFRAVRMSRSKSKSRAVAGRKGEGDHFVGNAMPKHLFSGKIDSTGKRSHR